MATVFGYEARFGNGYGFRLVSEHVTFTVAQTGCVTVTD
jgi:hypothetical protein